jgi:dethiobiotin synthetase
MNRVVTGVDTLFGKTYNSLGLSRSQDDVDACSRRMETQRDD